ncbi:MAG: cytochrome C oxidase subunit IV family protein [Acidimicrobiia bacterium]|jgi:cytochrome c oxidase subunit IV
MATAEHHAHPTAGQYVKIAVLLFVLTAVEVALFYLGEATELGAFEPIALIGLAFLKFVIVVGWYMHLRFEKTTLSRFFAAGFTLAIVLYAVVLAAFGVLALTS